MLDELESLLVMADVGIATTERITSELQARLARKELKDIDALRQGLRSSLLSILEPVSEPLEIRDRMIEAHIPYIEDAAAQGVQVLCFQEVFTQPYFCPSQDRKW